MKLCQKCIDAMRPIFRQEYGEDTRTALTLLDIDGVQESDCEFWAHHQLNITPKVRHVSACSLGAHYFLD